MTNTPAQGAARRVSNRLRLIPKSPIYKHKKNPPIYKHIRGFLRICAVFWRIFGYFVWVFVRGIRYQISLDIPYIYNTHSIREGDWSIWGFWDGDLGK